MPHNTASTFLPDNLPSKRSICHRCFPATGQFDTNWTDTALAAFCGS